jgi:hypothetical protein
MSDFNRCFLQATYTYIHTYHTFPRDQLTKTNQLDIIRIRYSISFSRVPVYFNIFAVFMQSTA